MDQYTGKIGNQIDAQFTDMQTGTFYVYVGNTGQKPLENVYKSNLKPYADTLLKIRDLENEVEELLKRVQYDYCFSFHLLVKLWTMRPGYNRI